MLKKILFLLLSLLAATFMPACRSKIKIKDDELYSRHLQRHVKLTIISTPLPSDKSELNLLLLNDGQDMDKWDMKHILDSLYRKGLIGPLIVAGIHAGNREQEYGVEGHPDYQNRGAKAGHYAEFVTDELYAYAKKQSEVRKFHSIAIAGASLGGLSAFDIAWNHADKIDKVGVFSGSFWWRDADANNPAYSDSLNRIMIKEIRSSRKKPKLGFWLYAGLKEETADRDNDSVIDVVDDTRDLITVIKAKQIPGAASLVYTEDPQGIHDYSSWSKALPAFLIWAFGK